MGDILQLVLKRLGLGAITLLVVSILIFFAVELLPGDIAQAHTWDEWIDLEQLELGTDLYARMIEHWCL